MKSIYLPLATIFFLILFSSCQKTPGPGGTSSIRGKVYAKYYDKYFYALTDSAYAPDADVYIIYGDEVKFGERQRTTYEGAYEFKFLRIGKYKIYAYSRDSTGAYKYQANQYAPNIAIIKEVEIKKNKEKIEVSDINVLQ